jgi:hypothetical protein
MPLRRGDLDQAARYLAYAIELLERQAYRRTATMRDVLRLAAQRLSPGDHFVGDAADCIHSRSLMLGEALGGFQDRCIQPLCHLSVIFCINDLRLIVPHHFPSRLLAKEWRKSWNLT